MGRIFLRLFEEGAIAMDWKPLTSAWAAVVVGAALNAPVADEEDQKPKYTIKEVMKRAHKEGGLFKKVVGDKATNKEKAKLLDLYQALEKNKPPKGSLKDWENRTKRIVAAAED